jgi:3-oxoadipate enol-lactonase
MSSTVAIEDVGTDKPWLVMVHGMSQNHKVFDRQVAAFRDEFRILLIDLPGHGLASSVNGPFGHVEFAQSVHASLRRHGVLAAHYWGTHTGTAAGLLIAAQAPEHFASLILEGPVLPGQNVAVVTKEILRARETAASKGVDAAIEAWWAHACWFDYMRDHPLECREVQHRAIIDEFGGRPWADQQVPSPVTDVSPQLAALAIPTLIYNGAFDHPEFLSEANRLAKLMPMAQITTIEDAGGFPAWERPDYVNARVKTFLSQV